VTIENRSESRPSAGERGRILGVDPTVAMVIGGAVLLVDRASGASLWQLQLDGPIEQPPLVRDRQLVVIAGRGDIHAYR